MKTIGIFSFFCFFGSLVIAGEQASVEGVGIGYYENMSASAFIYASELINKEDDVEEKRNTMRETSYMMFTYWCHSRIGDLNPSMKVDLIIQKLYRDIYSQNVIDSDRKLFKDPIGWLTSDEPVLSLPTPIDAVTRAEYKTLLVRYHVFINGDRS